VIPSHIPSTDNALEGFNRAIKYEFTHRINLEIPKYMKYIVELVYNQSKRTHLFMIEVPVPRKIWKMADKFKKENFIQDRDGLVYCLEKFDEENTITKPDIVKYTSFEDQSMEELGKILKSVVVINPIKKICSCSSYHQHNFCIHLQGYLLAYEKIEKPKIIVKKPKRGKKRRAPNDQENGKDDGAGHVTQQRKS
jgi:hypothetical protein